MKMHKQYDLKLFSGALIQLKHEQTNEYLFSNQVKLTSGSKQTMLGCTKNQLQEGSKFIIHLAYGDFGDMNRQPIQYGDLIYLQQNNQIVTININNKSQTTQQKEAILQNKEKEILSSQIFVITPIEIQNGQIQKMKEQIIGQAYLIRLVNIKTNYSLHSHTSYYKQKNLEQYREVTGFAERDNNDNWLINIHEYNLINGMIEIQPRFQKQINHCDKIIIRNAFLGTSLHSHSIMIQQNLQEVTTFNMIPRDNNDLWQIALFKLNQDKKEIVQELQYGSKFCLIHVKTNMILTHKYFNQQKLDVCCAQDQLNFNEWEIIPLYQQQIGLIYCNQFFLIKHIPTNQFLCSLDIQSYPSKQQYKVFLQNQCNNSSIWTIETSVQ